MKTTAIYKGQTSGTYTNGKKYEIEVEQTDTLIWVHGQNNTSAFNSFDAFKKTWYAPAITQKIPLASDAINNAITAILQMRKPEFKYIVDNLWQFMKLIRTAEIQAEINEASKQAFAAQEEGIEYTGDFFKSVLDNAHNFLVDADKNWQDIFKMVPPVAVHPMCGRPNSLANMHGDGKINEPIGSVHTTKTFGENSSTPAKINSKIVIEVNTDRDRDFIEKIMAECRVYERSQQNA